MAGSAYDEAVEAYLRDCGRRGLRPATLRYYRMVLARFGALTGLEAPGGLDLRTVRRFQDGSPQLAPGSMRGYLRALKTYAVWLTDEGLLADDPLKRLRLPRVDVPVLATPNDDELMALLRAAAPTLRVVVALIVGSGLRVADVAALEGHELRPGELIVAHTKNRAGRIVALDPVLEAILLRHRAGLGGRPGPLFRSRLGGRLSPDAVRRALADARGRAGVELRISPHVLRHWHARDLAAHGTTDRLLAARMGWRSSGLIARYAPVAQDELRRDVERYAPLMRLCDAGRLAGVFPAPVLRAGQAYSSKKDVA